MLHWEEQHKTWMEYDSLASGPANHGGTRRSLTKHIREILLGDANQTHWAIDTEQLNAVRMASDMQGRPTSSELPTGAECILMQVPKGTTERTFVRATVTSHVPYEDHTSASQITSVICTTTHKEKVQFPNLDGWFIFRADEYEYLMSSNLDQLRPPSSLKH